MENIDINTDTNTFLLNRAGTIFKTNFKYLGYCNGVKSFIGISELGDIIGDIKIAFIDPVNGKITSESNKVISITSTVLHNLEGGIMRILYLLLFKNNKNKKCQIMIEMKGNSINVLGCGEITFTNESITIMKTGKMVDSIPERYILCSAGASGNDRKVYNIYDQKNGKFLFDKFLYNIRYDKNNDRFNVQREEKSIDIEQYDSDGNKISKSETKSITFPKDKIQKVTFGGNKEYWLVEHYRNYYVIHEEYDYDEDKFIKPILFASSIHRYYKDVPVSHYGKTEIMDYTITMNKRTYDEPTPLCKDDSSKIFYRDPENNLCTVDVDGDNVTTRILYKSNGNTCDFGDIYIYDKTNGNFVISCLDGSKNEVLFIRDDGTIIYTDHPKEKMLRYDGNINDPYGVMIDSHVLHPFGIFVKCTDIERDNKRYTKYSFLKYQDGKIKEFNLSDDVDGVNCVHFSGVDKYSKTLSKMEYIFVGDDKNCYFYDSDLKQINKPDLKTVVSDGYYFTLDLKTNISHVSVNSKNLMEHNIGNYRPHKIISVCGSGLDSNSNRMIAFFASRIDENGKEKWSFFCTNGMYNFTGTPELFQIGEYDDIEIKHTEKCTWGKNEFLHISKKELSTNIFVCKNGEEEKYFGIGIDPNNDSFKLLTKHPKQLFQ